ncbi:putative ubiquitin-like-specific protease 1B [Colletotrichum gloeosporioides]|uniref:Putative ubiquitin-like-specific protease 1B n=1 Tax=Colletotrichum gloeosporioides TaxID=474922 RepID=A0A8H4CAR1_COLGL|nr:putative ubiquitin-like-specific protease 1B [Colletotrichum gloeosporioides]KAF3800499.1 putative ubiquitin-like-specific protease 1B [Colletotrichum gloeosporioides]
MSPAQPFCHATCKLTAMKQDNSQHRRRRPRPYGFLRKPTDFLERCVSRAQIQPSAFEYLWHPYPVPGSALLYYPGLDSRDPLAGCVIPCQLKSDVGGRHRTERTGQTSLRRGATLANLTVRKTDCDTERTPDEPKSAESKPFEGNEQLRSDRNRLIILPPSRRKSNFSSAATTTSTSRKRRAQDSEWDLIAGIADQAQFGEDSANRQSPLEPNKQGVGHSYTFSPLTVVNKAQRATGHTAWLLDTMTSVRGAVTKVSNSIAGYVYPRNYNAVELYSRDEHSGSITTKRIKLESHPDSASTESSREEQRGVASRSPKTNLVWVDESTRTANWHQVALLVRALRDIDRRIQKGRARERTSSPSSRPDDEPRSRRLHALSAHLRTLQQTAAILEHIYSHAFMVRLKEISRLPQPTMDYATNPDEDLAISAAKLFLDDLPDECASSLIEAGVAPRVIKGVSADLDAIVTQKPMPGLVHKAGFVGKMMKFFRGRDSFGVDSTDYVMPGSFPSNFPDTRKKEPAVSDASNIAVDPEERQSKGNPSKAFMPVTETDTYAYIREHLAEMETKGKPPHAKTIGGTSEDPVLKGIISPISKRDKSSPALKRLQKSRRLKKVHFSSPSKQSLPSPGKPTGFLSKFFRSRPELSMGSQLRKDEAESSLSGTQTDGSLDSRRSEVTTQDPETEAESDNTSEDTESEDTMARYRPRLVQHLNSSIRGHKSRALSDVNEPPGVPTRSPSPPTLAGLRISDDKEGELDDLSAALQLMLDEGEAQRRAEEGRKAKEAEEERLRRTGGLRVPKKRLVKSLSTDWAAKVQDSIHADPQQVLAKTAENVELRRHDFLKVVPETEWLNDEIVNGSLLWLDRYVNEAAGATDVKSTKRVCLAMNSFFYKRLVDNGVQNTERALRRYGVTKATFLNLETILMPICSGNHWTLLVVRPQKRTVSHMDSLNPRGTSTHTKRGLAWVQAVLGDDFKADEWRVVKHEAPEQDNGYDCGVFTITNGICLALGLNAIDAYSKDELPLQRRRIAAMLLNKGFKGDFDLADL